MHVEISTINRHFKHVFCPISRIRRNHEKKTLQLIFLSLQGPASGTAYGNRTHDSAVRGLRLNLLTNAAYFVFVSRDKCYYTDASGALQGKIKFLKSFFAGSSAMVRSVVPLRGRPPLHRKKFSFPAKHNNIFLLY